MRGCLIASTTSVRKIGLTSIVCCFCFLYESLPFYINAANSRCVKRNSSSGDSIFSSRRPHQAFCVLCPCPTRSSLFPPLYGCWTRNVSLTNDSFQPGCMWVGEPPSPRLSLGTATAYYIPSGYDMDGGRSRF
jgi:hypothetical protein